MTNIEKNKLLNECNSLKQNIDRMCECQSRVELYTIFKFIMQDLIEIERMNEIRIHNNDMYCNKELSDNCPYFNGGKTTQHCIDTHCSSLKSDDNLTYKGGDIVMI